MMDAPGADWPERMVAMDAPATCQRIRMNCGISTESLSLERTPAGQSGKRSPVLVFDEHRESTGDATVEQSVRVH
jgi:hypothetical protein